MKIVIPDSNSIRFVKKQWNSQPTGSTFTQEQAPFNRNYFNTRYFQEIQDNIGAVGLYAQKYGDYSNYILQTTRGEATTIQLLSDTALTDNANIKAVAKLASGANAFVLPTLSKKIDNLTHKIKFTNVNFVNIAGYLSFYFTTGVYTEYSVSPAVLETGNYYLNGDIPVWMAAGQSVNIFVSPGNANNGTATITATQFEPTVNAFIFITNKLFTAVTETTADVTITYQRFAFDVYEYELSGYTKDACIYFEITTSTDSFATTLETWQSDVLFCETDPTDGILLMRWKSNKDKYLIDFRTGLMPFFYVPAEMYHLKPEILGDNYTTETGDAKLYGTNYKRRFEFVATGLPRHFVEKLALIVGHDTVYINEKEFVFIAGTFSDEPIEDTMLYTVKFELYEPELLGIYSTDYVNTTLKTSSFGLEIDGDGNLLNIDNNGNTLDIQQT